jgi:hypothetical protein
VVRTFVVGCAGNRKLTTLNDRGTRLLGVRVIKQCNFTGCHNRSRALCYLMLGYSDLAAQQNGKLTSRQISILSGIPYNSVLSRVGKWVELKFIKRELVKLRDGRTVYAYSLAPRGREWLDRHWIHMMAQLSEYEAELKGKRGHGFLGCLLNLPDQSAVNEYASGLEDDSEEDDDERL